MSGDFLQQMAESSRERVRAAKTRRSLEQMRALAESSPEPPRLQADARGFDLIAEVKLRSPAVGELKPVGEDIDTRVAGYAAAGAAAISVLTEPLRFAGALEHLETASRALASTRVPTMRKDFLVDPWQVMEARAAGAGGVLIILRMLPRLEIEALIEQALALNLFSLLEAFDEQDIELAHALVEKYAARANGNGGAANASANGIRLLVGVNCRDLATLQVVPGRLETLARYLPTAAPRVAESGVGSAEDAARVAGAGYDFALVGSALMTTSEPRALVAAMLDAGRAARALR